MEPAGVAYGVAMAIAARRGVLGHRRRLADLRRRRKGRRARARRRGSRRFDVGLRTRSRRARLPRRAARSVIAAIVVPTWDHAVDRRSAAHKGRLRAGPRGSAHRRAALVVTPCLEGRRRHHMEDESCLTRPHHVWTSIAPIESSRVSAGAPTNDFYGSTVSVTIVLQELVCLNPHRREGVALRRAPRLWDYTCRRRPP